MRGRFTPKGMTDVAEMEERGVSSAVDLRSDTVTRPSAEMRRAMAAAEVGDDVYGEDPTVNRLEQRAAEIFGREAALFVPTGTMGNQIAVHLHTRPGQEIVCEARSHVYNYEMAMAAAFSGCLVRPVASSDGRLDWRQVAPQLSLAAPYHRARTGLAVLENTHNMAGGVVTGAAQTAELCRRFHELEIPVHLDGARIFNAAAAAGASVAELSRDCDSVMFCLSKGLGAPVGSMLAGSRDFIHRARIVRKMLGGGMRQAGVLAAAGLVALEKGPARLAQDHALAKRLAEGLAEIRGVEIDPARVETNIVIFGTARTGFSAAEIVARMAEHNVLAGAAGPDAIRLVTHLDVDAAKIEEALRVIRAAIERA
ncbi:MAG TPA: GntG family PLP-dependent aldolase [Terriglobales bacterium]|nr:GntG family PLP-dependent aldolase [Terriglobales bacterium]